VDVPATTWRACAVAGVLLALASGCEKSRPGTTPEDTWAAVRNSILDHDCAALWGLMSSDARERESARMRSVRQRLEAEMPRFTQEHKDLFRREMGIGIEEYINLPTDEFFALELRNQTYMVLVRKLVRTGEVKSMSIAGDRATVALSLPGGKEAEVALERSRGLWRLPDLAELVRAADMLTGPGDTPEETFAALIACVRSNAVDDVWDLASRAYRESLETEFRQVAARMKELPEEHSRIFKRNYGVSVDDFAALPLRRAAEVMHRMQLDSPVDASRPSGPTRRDLYISAGLSRPKVTGTFALVEAACGPTGSMTLAVRLVFEGGFWKLMDMGDVRRGGGF
jgi:hypothetical protein